MRVLNVMSWFKILLCSLVAWRGHAEYSASSVSANFSPDTAEDIAPTSKRTASRADARAGSESEALLLTFPPA
jgi:hypothetical protein